jgi:sentrin-specific protease 7
LDIQHSEIIKILISFQKPLNVIFLYTLPTCSAYVRESLEMGQPSDNRECSIENLLDTWKKFALLPVPYYNSASRVEPHKRITLLMESITNEARTVIKTIFSSTILEEIILRDANELLMRSSPRDLSANSGNNNNNGGNNSNNV